MGQSCPFGSGSSLFKPADGSFLHGTSAFRACRRSQSCWGPVPGGRRAVSVFSWVSERLIEPAKLFCRGYIRDNGFLTVGQTVAGNLDRSGQLGHRMGGTPTRLWDRFDPARRDVAVVIPVYKQTVDQSERLALAQCCRVFRNRTIVAVAPESLVLSGIAELRDLSIERFPDECFRGIAGYNRLMLSPDFYARFLSFRYILVHQLDAFVFSDQLDEWMEKGYDYVGAPWIGLRYDSSHPVVHRDLPFWARGFFSWFQATKAVGNGGFSLRRVRAHFWSLRLLRRKAERVRINEDVFWSVLVPLYLPFFRIPGQSEALAFAFETSPRLCYTLAEERLPFGCHGWEAHDPSFWRPHIERASADLSSQVR